MTRVNVGISGLGSIALNLAHCFADAKQQVIHYGKLIQPGDSKMTMEQPMSPDAIAEAAHRIYDERFRDQYEGSHDNEFLAIDVVNETAYHGTYPEDALAKAREAVPEGTFYLIRVGAGATFNVGYTGVHKIDVDWLLRFSPHRSSEIQPA